MNQAWRQLLRQGVLVVLLLVGLSLGLVSCGGGSTSGGSSGAGATSVVSRLVEVPPPTTIQQLHEFAPYQPQVKILSPRRDEVVSDTQTTVRLQVEDLPVFKDAKTGVGPYVQLLVDDRPYRQVSDLNAAIALEDLEPGSHTLRALAMLPWNESFKNPSAYAQTTFHVFTKTPERLPDLEKPLVIYSPLSRYGAEPLLLDFYLANAPTHVVTREDGDDTIPDWRIRCTINGEQFTFDRWQPLYLKGLKPGKNWVQLELLDQQGQPIANAFNDTVRVINYEPGGTDAISQLVRGELAIADARRIVDPNYEPPAPPPEPVPEVVPTPEPEVPETTPQTEPTQDATPKPEPAQAEPSAIEPPEAERSTPQSTQTETPNVEPSKPEAPTKADAQSEPSIEETPVQPAPVEPPAAEPPIVPSYPAEASVPPASQAASQAASQSAQAALPTLVLEPPVGVAPVIPPAATPNPVAPPDSAIAAAPESASPPEAIAPPAVAPIEKNRATEQNMAIEATATPKKLAVKVEEAKSISGKTVEIEATQTPEILSVKVAETLQPGSEETAIAEVPLSLEVRCPPCAPAPDASTQAAVTPDNKATEAAPKLTFDQRVAIAKANINRVKQNLGRMSDRTQEFLALVLALVNERAQDLVGRTKQLMSDLRGKLPQAEAASVVGIPVVQPGTAPSWIDRTKIGLACISSFIAIC